MSTATIRFKRMHDRNTSHRDYEDQVIDKADSFKGGVQELAEALKRNNDMLDAIIKHLDIPYKPTGFVKE